MLAGVGRADSGDAWLFGERVTRGSIDTRRLVGLLSEKPVFPRWMAAGRAIELAGQLADMSGAEARRRRREVLEQVGLTSVAHRKVAGFSRGMRQRHRPRRGPWSAGGGSHPPKSTRAVRSPLSRGEAPRILAPVGSCPFDRV